MRLRRRWTLGGRGDHGRDDRELDLEAECVHGRLLESREVAVSDPAVVKVRWGDETEAAGIDAGVEGFDPRLPRSGCDPAPDLLMECLPLHGGRAWFCHLNSPASFFISCPHTYPQGVEKSPCFGSGPNSQRRLGRNLSPGKYGRSHMSGGEYMGTGKASAKGGNTAVSRDGTNHRFPESHAVEGFHWLAESGNHAERRRFALESDEVMFRGQWRIFAARSETSRFRRIRGGRTASAVESRRPESSRSLCDLPIGDTSP